MANFAHHYFGYFNLPVFGYFRLTLTGIRGCSPSKRHFALQSAYLAKDSKGKNGQFLKNFIKAKNWEMKMQDW